MTSSDKFEYRNFLTVSAAVFLALILTVAPLPDIANAQDPPARHTVQSGETLFSISRQYDISVAQLREWNDLEDDHLQSGMEVYVAPPEPREAVVHTVQAGETLFGISRQYGVTLAELEQWNQLEDRIISPGQELVIHGDGDSETVDAPEPPDTAGEETVPETAPEEPHVDDQPDEESLQPAHESLLADATERRAGTTTYTVQSGDNLNQIANAHGMTTNELRSLNDMEGDLIRVGQQLVVRQTATTPVIDEFADESTPQGRFTRYRVQSGESLSEVLESHRMGRAEFEALNPGVNPERLSSGQQITVLAPPTREFENPYLTDRNLQNLGEVPVTRYPEDQTAFPTTSGELYSPTQLTAAHANMTLGSIVYVENPETGRGVFVKINDRTPGEGIQLSERAYRLLGYREGMTSTALIYQQE